MTIALTPEESRLAIHFGLISTRLHIAQQSLPDSLVEMILKLYELSQTLPHVKPSVSDPWLQDTFHFLHLSLVGMCISSYPKEVFHQIEALLREACCDMVPENYATLRLRSWVETNEEPWSLPTVEVVEQMMLVLLSPIAPALSSLDEVAAVSFSRMVCEYLCDLMELRPLFGINITAFHDELIRFTSLRLCSFSLCFYKCLQSCISSFTHPFTNHLSASRIS